MAFPDGLILRTLTAGSAITHTGLPVLMKVTITPSLRLVHESSGMILSAMVVEETIDPGQIMSVEVPAVGQGGVLGPDGLPVTFWSYLVQVREYRYEPTAGAMFTTPPLGTYKPQPAVTKTIQPVASDEPLDLDTVPANGYITTPLGPAWLGPDEADVPAEAGLWIDNSDPTKWVFKNRTVAA